MKAAKGSSMRALRVIAVLLAALAGAAAADCDRGLTQFRMSTWQVGQGLPLDSVYAFAQSPDGFLWVGTEDGLARFDGVHFERLDLTGVLDDAPEHIESLAVDAAGNVFAGTVESGVVQIPVGRRHEPRLVHRADGSVRSLIFDAEGTLWAGVRAGGLLAGSAPGPAFVAIDAVASDQTVSALAVRLAGGVWLGHGGEGVAWYDGSRTHRLLEASGLGDLYVEALLESRDGSLWIAARSGLFRVADGRVENVSEAWGLTDDAYPSTLFEARDGSIWVGTAGAGVLRSCAGRIERLGTGEGLPSGSVASVFQDHEGSMWLATGGGGIVQLAVGAALPIGPAQGLPVAPVLPILQHSDGTMWIGTFGGGVVNMRPDGPHRFGLDEELSSDRVLALAEGQDGELWIGTRDGLNRLRPDGRIDRFGTEAGLPHYGVAALYSDGPRMWVGGADGLAEQTAGGWRVHQPESGSFGAAIVALFKDSSDRLWIGTDGGGLFVLDDSDTANGRTVRQASFHDEMPSRTVLGFLETAAGILWIHTSRGLARWDGQQLGRVTMLQGLPDTQILSLIDGGHGGFWMSGNRGVFRVDAAALDAVAQGSDEPLEVLRFDASDGMPSTETNGGFQPAAWRARDGRIWYPTMAGVAVFDPKRIVTPRAPPPVTLQSIEVDGVPIRVEMPLKITARPDWIEIAYAAPTFLRAERLRFEHRLKGFDDNWFPTSSRSALFRKPPPGNFSFEVRVQEPGGEWSEPAFLELTVRRHLLEQPAVRLAGVVLLVAVTGALGWWQTRRRVFRRRQLQRMQQLEAVGLLAGGVAHDFNNVLTAIMGNAEFVAEQLPEGTSLRANANAVVDAAERGAGLTRQLLAFSRRQSAEPQWIDLARELAGMEGFLRTVVRRNVELSLDLPLFAGFCLIDPVKLQQVILNLVVNARDAMADGGSLHLELSMVPAVGEPPGAATRGMAWMSARDTGCGMTAAVRKRVFEPFYTTKAEGEGTGLGMAVSYGIIRQAGGSIDLESAPGAGTTFRIALPVLRHSPAVAA